MKNKKTEEEDRENNEGVAKAQISLAPGVSVTIISSNPDALPFCIGEAERLSAGISRRGWKELDNIYLPKKHKNNEVV